MKNPSYLAVHIADISPGEQPRNRTPSWAWTLLAGLALAAAWMWKVML